MSDTNQNPAQNDHDEIVFDFETNGFEEAVDASFPSLAVGSVVKAQVTNITKDFVTVDVGYKSQGQIPIAEFHAVGSQSDDLGIGVGDDVEIYIECLEDFDGQVVFSKEKARCLAVWEDVKRIYENEETIFGTIVSKIKGGLSVDIGVRAFLPGSQVDLRPSRNFDQLLGERFEFRVLKYNQKRSNIVLSRRLLLELDWNEKRNKTLESLEEGSLRSGTVKNITDYGIFVDLGGVDGLLHITDMTWGRISHPTEMFNIGDEIEVLVLSFNRETEKVSLGYKQKGSDPWEQVATNYKVGSVVSGRVVSLANYGAFIELEPGIEGLLHISEMSWSKKTRQTSSMLQMNDIVEAKVKDLDIEQKRISLSIKELQPNPWLKIAQTIPLGSVVKGVVRNIADFGIFVSIEEGVDGLVHISDISWSQRQRRLSELFQKGQEIDVKLLNIDVEKGRLSFGIKQMQEDPWSKLEERIQVGQEITGKIVYVTDFGVFVEIEAGVEGLIHSSEMGHNLTKKTLQEMFIIGHDVIVKAVKIDSKERRLGLAPTDNTMVAATSEQLAAEKKQKVQEGESAKSKDADSTEELSAGADPGSEGAAVENAADAPAEDSGAE